MTKVSEDLWVVLDGLLEPRFKCAMGCVRCLFNPGGILRNDGSLGGSSVWRIPQKVIDLLEETLLCVETALVRVQVGVMRMFADGLMCLEFCHC